MSANIVIYGAGGLGREITLILRDINQVKKSWNLLGFYDDGKQIGEQVDGLPVLGGLHHLNTLREKLDVVIAIADPLVRKKISSALTNTYLQFPVLVHPHALTGDPERNTFKKGVIITAGTICTTGISLNEFVIVNLSCTIGHDTKIGKFCTLMPACHISGNVVINEGVLVGTGAIVLQNLKIGEGAIIGAGAVVTKNVSDGKKVIGVPAREMHK
jgi:sugar O-acyltransferase (sialic acid O-acetyltransferase NeuD family)